VIYKIMKLGGKDFTDALINYVRLRYGLLIGEKTAEEAKLHLGSVLTEKERVLELSGRSIETGMPKTTQVKTNVLFEALFPYFSQLVETIRDTLEQTPPELIKDINTKGIFLSGMSSRIEDIDKFLEKELKIKIVLRDEPEYDVVRGLGWLIEHRDIMKKLSVKFEK
ncbi:MAG: rod shape-determining protein, partial [Patescibacteria group bacterium]